MIATDVTPDLRRRSLEVFYQSLKLKEPLIQALDSYTARAIIYAPRDSSYIRNLARSLAQLNAIVEGEVEDGDDQALTLFLSVAVAAIIPNPEAIVEVQALGTNLNQQRRATKEKVAVAEAAVKQRDTLMRLMRGLFHDIRTPLSSIRTSVYLNRKYLELRQAALDGGSTGVVPLVTTEWKVADADQPLVERGETINLQVKFVTELMNNVEEILALKVDQKEFEPQDLGLLVTEATRQLQDEATQKGLVLQLEVRTAESATVNGNSLQLKRTLLNVIGNAIKYTDQGSVTVRLIQQDNELVLTVQDTGPGLSDEDRARLFEPFFRSTRTAKKPGTGLGLVVVKDIIEQHGGEVAVQSVLDHGTTFTIHLPLMPKTESDDTLETAEVAEIVVFPN